MLLQAPSPRDSTKLLKIIKINRWLDFSIDDGTDSRPLVKKSISWYHLLHEKFSSIYLNSLLDNPWPILSFN